MAKCPEADSLLTMAGPRVAAPGLRIARRCRDSGTYVSLYDGDTPDFPVGRAEEESARWLVYCEHGYHEWFASLRVARSALSHPEEWCGRCIELDDFWTDMENRDDGLGPHCTGDDWVLSNGWTMHVRCDADGCQGVDA